MYRLAMAPISSNPLSGRFPRAAGLPWWGGAFLGLAVVAPPVAAQASSPAARIDFPNSLAPWPPGTRVTTAERPVADDETVEFQVAFQTQNGAFPPAGDYLALATWLKAQGFTLSGVDRALRLSIGVRGTVAQARAALLVRYARVEIDGKSWLAAESVPSLPALVGRSVLGINGLQPYERMNKGPRTPHPIAKKPSGF